MTTQKKAIEIHEAVNEKIKSFLNLKSFLAPSVKRAEDGFTGDTDLLKTFITQNKAGEAYFNALTLYPDQLVYTAGRMGSQIEIDAETGKVFYRAGEKEARTIEENACGAWLM